MERRNNIVTVFFQGNGSSRAQGAKYCGDAGITVSTPVTYTAVLCDSMPYRPTLIHNAYTYDELVDVSYAQSWWPLHWAAHALSAFALWWNGIEGAPSHHVLVSHLNVAGPSDVQQCMAAVRRCHADHADNKNNNLANVVLFGTSRGAATAFVACTMLPPEELPALLVLEAPFDTVDHVLQESVWPFRWLQHAVLRLCTSFDSKQPSPLSRVADFPLHLPVAFVTSAADTRVPPECTQPLIDGLRARGHEHVHHLQLQHSSHCSMACQHAEDVAAYQEFLESMYDKYCADGLQ